jgi:hypothetical protein
VIEQHRHLPDGVGGDAMLAGLKSSPGVAVTVGAMAGMSIETGVALLTALYLLVSLAHLIWKWRRQAKGGSLDG